MQVSRNGLHESAESGTSRSRRYATWEPSSLSRCAAKRGRGRAEEHASTRPSPSPQPLSLQGRGAQPGVLREQPDEHRLSSLKLPAFARCASLSLHCLAGHLGVHMDVKGLVPHDSKQLGKLSIAGIDVVRNFKVPLAMPIRLRFGGLSAGRSRTARRPLRVMTKPGASPRSSAAIRCGSEAWASSRSTVFMIRMAFSG